MNKITSFSTPRQDSTASFQLMFPEAAKEIKLYEKAKALELCIAEGSISATEAVERKYAAIFERIATQLLIEDGTLSKKGHKTKTSAISVNMTPKVKETLKMYCDRLMDAGVIVPTSGKHECLVCGNKIDKGSLFLQMNDGTSESVHVDCCSADVYVMEDSDICIAE